MACSCSKYKSNTLVPQAPFRGLDGCAHCSRLINLSFPHEPPFGSFCVCLLSCLWSDSPAFLYSNMSRLTTNMRRTNVFLSFHSFLRLCFLQLSEQRATHRSAQLATRTPASLRLCPPRGCSSASQPPSRSSSAS